LEGLRPPLVEQSGRSPYSPPFIQIVAIAGWLPSCAGLVEASGRTPFPVGGLGDGAIQCCAIGVSDPWLFASAMLLLPKESSVPPPTP